MIEIDVPSPIDLREMTDARQWADQAMVRRPWRTEFFEAFARELRGSSGPGASVLELGSGPGFLARHVLEALPGIRYVALDFSSAMHQLAMERLGTLAGRVEFVERSFLAADWTQGLGIFDHVITHQAVHELRHKRHARRLHEQVLSLLARDGTYLVCDHFVGDGGMKNDQLYMTMEEQTASLLAAGFGKVETLLVKGGLALQRASR